MPEEWQRLASGEVEATYRDVGELRASVEAPAMLKEAQALGGQIVTNERGYYD